MSTIPAKPKLRRAPGVEYVAKADTERQRDPARCYVNEGYPLGQRVESFGRRCEELAAAKIYRCTAIGR
jgi:hypothetical protein